MDEQNNKNTNPKAKKSLGMLIMILALVLVVVILVIVIVASSGGDDTTTPSSTPSSTPVSTTTTATPPSTSTPTTTSSLTTPITSTVSTPVSTTRTPVTPVTPTLTETPSKADAEGKVTLNSADAATGALILVDKTHPYTFGNLFAGGADAKVEDILNAGFYRISNNTLLNLSSSGYDSFLRQEAFQALVAMLTTFDSVANPATLKPFRVVGYTSSSVNDVTDSLITGNVAELLILEGTGTLGFNYSAKKVTVDGTTMTYEAWFQANCAKYGFVYEGLVGTNENHLSGRFRYVGSIHAAGIAAAGSLSAYLEGVKNNTITTATAADGSTWNLSYVQASTEATTEINVGAEATYVVSGDNLGGFVVAVKAETPAA